MDRGGVVIISNYSIAVIKRVKGDRTYYTFPGGQQELGESIEETAIREAFEELGVRVALKELLMKVPYNGDQYYFTADIIAGQFGTGRGPEFTQNDGSYEAMWLSIDALKSVDIFPREVVEKVTEIVKD